MLPLHSSADAAQPVITLETTNAKSAFKKICNIVASLGVALCIGSTSFTREQVNACCRRAAEQRDELAPSHAGHGRSLPPGFPHPQPTTDPVPGPWGRIVLNRGVSGLSKCLELTGRRHCRPRKTWRRDRAPKASIQNLHRKGTKGPLHCREIDEKTNSFKQTWARRHEQHRLAAIEMLDH